MKSAMACAMCKACNDVYIMQSLQWRVHHAKLAMKRTSRQACNAACIMQSLHTCPTAWQQPALAGSQATVIPRVMASHLYTLMQ